MERDARMFIGMWLWLIRRTMKKKHTLYGCAKTATSRPAIRILRKELAVEENTINEVSWNS